MGVLFDYFTAPSDEVAAAVIDDGPSPYVDGKGIDPVVMMGTLEAELTGRTYDEVDAARGHEPPVAIADGGEQLVQRTPDTLVAALAAASDERLAEVAVLWSQTEEFWGEGDPEVLAGFLGEMAELARHTRASRQHMYCRTCV